MVTRAGSPVPPCSPLTPLNRLVESVNLISDLHPYYPVPECPHPSSLAALLAGYWRAGFPTELVSLIIFYKKYTDNF